MKFKGSLKYIISFLITVVFVIVHMALKGCYPFGDNSLLYGDAMAQYIGFYDELMDLVNDGGSLLFSWNGGLGYDFYSSFFYYLADPIYLLIFLFGKSHIELGTVVIILVHLGLIGVSGCFFFTHTSLNKFPNGKLNDCVCVLFATSFAMCDYILSYQHNIIWLASIILLPLVALGLEKLVENGDFRLYVVALFLTLVANFYYAWFICLFAVFYFLDRQGGSIKEFFKGFVRFAAASILSALCAAAVLVPCYIQALSRDPKDTDVSMTYVSNIGDFLQGFFWGTENSLTGISFFPNNGYVGIFACLLCIIFAFIGGTKSARIKRIVLLVILSICQIWLGAYYVVHGLTLPHGSGQRFAIALSFFMIITAFEALAAIRKVRIRHALGAVAIAFACLIVVFVTTEEALDILIYYANIMAFVYLAICICLFKRKSIKWESLIINFLIIGFLEIISNGFIAMAERYEITTYEDRYEISEWAEVYDAIATADGERKHSSISGNMTFWYSDASIFTSTCNQGLYNLLAALGNSNFEEGVTIYYRCTTPLLAALFNVDYVVTNESAAFGGYVVESDYTMTDGTTYSILETAYDTEFAFVLSEDVLTWDTSSELAAENQNNFTNNVLGVGDIFTEIRDVEMEVTGRGVVITQEEDNTCSYVNINIAGMTFTYIEYEFQVPYDMHLYYEATDEENCMTVFYIDGNIVYEGHNILTQELIEVGELSAGQQVKILVCNDTELTEESTTTLTLYNYHDDVMQECLAIMNNSPMEITSFSDTYVSGVVNVTEENQVLYTSIPYYKGWSVYVDGEKVDVSLIGDALIGVELEAGDHVVEFKYFPYGLKLGIIMSLIGLCLAVILWRRYIKKGVEASAPTPQDIP